MVDIRKSLEKTLEIRNDGRDLRLLQHDFADPYGVRVARAAPWQIARRAVVPCEQFLAKLTLPKWIGCNGAGRFRGQRSGCASFETMRSAGVFLYEHAGFVSKHDGFLYKHMGHPRARARPVCGGADSCRCAACPLKLNALRFFFPLAYFIGCHVACSARHVRRRRQQRRGASAIAQRP